MPLTVVQTGRKVKIIEMKTDSDMQGRLAAMGMIPGEDVEVISNSLNGPFLVAVKGCRMMLGRGVAGQIVVE